MASADDQPGETWETLRGLISDLELLLSADSDELRSLDELRRVRQDIKTVVTGREADARRVIQGEAVSRPVAMSETAPRASPRAPQGMRGRSAVGIHRRQR